MDKLLKIIADTFSPNGISLEMRSDMMRFMAEKWYNEYNDYRMNKEWAIKNRVDAMNIVLPNAKAGEAYYQLVKINDQEITAYWLEGLEETGLSVVPETLPVSAGDSLPELTIGASGAVPDEADGADGAGAPRSVNDRFLPGDDPVGVNNAGGSEKEGEKNIPATTAGSPARGILIRGIPVATGDFDVVLKYKYAGWFEGCAVLERKFKFVVNPDPRSLWKDIPTDENIKFFKKDYACEYVAVAENEKGIQKDIVAASKRGRSHAHEGKARDDDFQLFHNADNGWYILAVADGAGSAKYSRKGSEVACHVSVEHCRQALENPADLEKAVMALNSAGEGFSNRALSTIIYNIVGGAAHRAHRAVLEIAKANEDQPRDYSTTLLLAICKKFDFGWFVASFWVGDGAMCIYDKERQYFKLLGTPDGGEYAGQTRFLTMKEIFTPESIMSRLKYSIEQDFTALLLATDGISDPFFETDANLNRIEKWNELWKNINEKVTLSDNNSESQYQLLKWLDFWSPGNHDDRTIAILY